MTVEELKKVLGGRGVLPLMKERVQNLNELGHVIRSRYAGKAVQLVAAAEHSAVTLARLLANELRSFRDVATYKKEKIYFYKRAQIFASDLHSAFNGKGWGNFSDAHKLTAFADYKLPQVLRHAGILQYSKTLSEKVDNLKLLKEGSEEEIEIRAHTIWAVERIRQRLEKRGKKLSASHIDWFLWSLGQNDPYRTKPYHRTKTIFY
jgi:hypothetical protein